MDLIVCVVYEKLICYLVILGTHLKELMVASEGIFDKLQSTDSANLIQTDLCSCCAQRLVVKELI